MDPREAGSRIEQAARGTGGDSAPLPVGVWCPGCGYDLRGLTSDRCPECGLVLKDLHWQESSIPWVHRQQMGRFRAYWKTVGLIIRWPVRFHREAARPVRYSDSQSFRWVTAGHAYAFVLLASVLCVVFDHVGGWGVGEVLWWLLGGLQIWSLLLLAAIPGLASYFFHPRRLPIEQQNRAIAMSYYAWAPAGLLPVALIPVVLGLGLAKPPNLIDGAGLPLACAVIMGVVLVVGCELRLYGLSRSALHNSVASSLLRLSLINALSVVAAILLLLVPLAIFYIIVICYSLM